MPVGTEDTESPPRKKKKSLARNQAHRVKHTRLDLNFEKGFREPENCQSIFNCNNIKHTLKYIYVLHKTLAIYY